MEISDVFNITIEISDSKIEVEDAIFINEKLLEIKWWDWDYEKIYDAIPLLQSGEVDQLINEASKDDIVAFND